MLRLENIKKDYKVADTYVHALKGVSLAFRRNEFVSILGPSGCGKTTMLNIIGGLDKYSSGDLFINGKSTKDFKDKDWDVYRNHRIGFIFQSYNLIPHQTILGNVELALTIAGLPKEERIKRAKKAIDRVGLEGQYNKRPNQLSGGQCQRVAIARALVNEPEILLADEPTGALDTQTSIQIMELIKEISQEKLVIMVTHNPDLAKQYSTRIVRLLDGELVTDSNPYTLEEERNETLLEEAKTSQEETVIPQEEVEAVQKKEKAKMSFWTAFKLSLRNLFTKKARTALTCVAGSIGIIGVSSVLAVSSGVQGYITSMQDDMLSGNPVQISETAYDLSAMMTSMGPMDKVNALKIEDGKVNVNEVIKRLITQGEAMEKMQISNNITQDYIDYVYSI
ncbi:MAG: ABC transporter ATP-binding protein, partial [Anaeroplasmataceae bacterium]|nr:ABC transporter ATP-binding protein [Anaeroplasmataceae bacterium]